MALGHDTIIVEEICARIVEKVDVVISPSFDYGPTGYALVGGLPEGTIDPDYDGFYRNVKGILRNFLEMRFKRIVIIIMHQGMDCPLAQSFSRVWSELRFERPLEKLPRGWWANPSYRDTWDDFGVVEVSPLAITRPRFCSPRAPSWWSRSGWTATFSGIAVWSARIRPAGAPTSNTDRP